MHLDKRHLPFLDGIRGIAILAVFLCHSLGAAYGMDMLPWDGPFRSLDAPISFLMLYPFTYGNAGVAVFFVISGFCIHLSHRRSNVGWKAFANRRFFRIYPPYLLAVALFFFVWPWGEFAIDSFSRLAQLCTHIFLIHNFGKETCFGLNPSFWSIAVEIQLYLIYPVLQLLETRLGWRRTLAIVGTLEISITFLSSLPGVQIPFFLTRSPFAYWFSWSLGAYLCDCFLTRREVQMFSLRFDILAGIVFALPLFKPTAPFTFVGFAFLTATAIERLMTGKWKLPQPTSFRKVWAHLSFLGIVSYSFYLFHQPLLHLTRSILTKAFPNVSMHPLLVFGGCLAWYPVILGLSYVIYRLVEKPSIDLGKLIWKASQRRGNEEQPATAIAISDKSA